MEDTQNEYLYDHDKEGRIKTVAERLEDTQFRSDKNVIVDRLKELSDIINKISELKVATNIEQIIKQMNVPIPILFMGEFNAGKSTLINAVLGEQVVKEGIIPTTAVKTVVRYGQKRMLYKITRNGNKVFLPFSDLDRLTSEINESSSKERIDIDAIIVEIPNPLLRNVTLIDSPGQNSIYDYHTQQSVESVYLADHIFWIFKYNSVGKGSEINKLLELNKLGLKPFGIINMLDLHDEDDATSYINLEYYKLKQYLSSLVGVSALEAKESLHNNDEELWEISGFPNLIEQIQLVSNDSVNRIQKTLPMLKNLFFDLYELLTKHFKSQTEIKRKLENNLQSISYDKYLINQKFEKHMDKLHQLNNLYQLRDNLSHFFKRAKVILSIQDEMVLNFIEKWINLVDVKTILKKDIELHNHRVNEYKNHYLANFKGKIPSKIDYFNHFSISKYLKGKSRQLKKREKELEDSIIKMRTKLDFVLSYLETQIYKDYRIYKDNIGNLIKSLEYKHKTINNLLLEYNLSTKESNNLFRKIQQIAFDLETTYKKYDFPEIVYLLKSMNEITKLPISSLPIFNKDEDTNNLYKYLPLERYNDLNLVKLKTNSNTDELNYTSPEINTVPKYFGYILAHLWI